jgi:hypothetical protein
MEGPVQKKINKRRALVGYLKAIIFGDLVAVFALAPSSPGSRAQISNNCPQSQSSSGIMSGSGNVLPPFNKLFSA